MIVVDACVVHSASESSVPLPKQCREALNAIKNGDLTAVACETLLAEWRNHRSKYALTWLTSMFARRRLKRVTGYLAKSAGAELAVSRLPEPHRSIGLKDIHLLRLAIDHDGLIVSSEKRCQAAFSSAKAGFPQIGIVAFVDPAVGAPLLNCLTGAAPIDPSWNL